jgi:hypothetical protein
MIFITYLKQKKKNLNTVSFQIVVQDGEMCELFMSLKTEFHVNNICIQVADHSGRAVCILIFILSGVRLTAATTGLLYGPQMIDDCVCGAIGEMKIGRGSRSTRWKPAPALLSPLQIPHEQTRTGTQAAEVGSQRLTPNLWRDPGHGV